VVQLGKGALLTKTDIKQAYRNIPVHSWRLPTVRGVVKRDLCVGKVLPFGLHSVPLSFLLWPKPYSGSFSRGEWNSCSNTWMITLLCTSSKCCLCKKTWWSLSRPIKILVPQLKNGNVKDHPQSLVSVVLTRYSGIRFVYQQISCNCWKAFMIIKAEKQAKNGTRYRWLVHCTMPQSSETGEDLPSLANQPLHGS